MTETLKEILNNLQAQSFATEAGLRMHERLQRVFLPDIGDAEILTHIKNNPELARIFDAMSKTEVPIAGYINGKFVSRRIDRLRIDDASRTIDVLDYKTDVNYVARHAQYVAQLREYKQLLENIYPNYTINGFILWTHDWTVEPL